MNDFLIFLAAMVCLSGGVFLGLVVYVAVTWGRFHD